MFEKSYQKYSRGFLYFGRLFFFLLPTELYFEVKSVNGPLAVDKLLSLRSPKIWQVAYVFVIREYKNLTCCLKIRHEENWIFSIQRQTTKSYITDHIWKDQRDQ